MGTLLAAAVPSIIGGATSLFSARKGERGAERAAATASEQIGLARQDLSEQLGLSLEEVDQLFGQAVGELRQRTQARTAEAALAGALGPEAEAQALAGFQESPGQRFLREQQEEAILRNAAAIGGLGGGNVQQALQEAAFGRAATDLQTRLANLRSLAGREQQQQFGIADLLARQGTLQPQLRMQAGSNLASTALGGVPLMTQPIQAGGQFGAAGVLGAGSALQQGIQQVGTTLGQTQVMPHGRSAFARPIVNPSGVAVGF